MTNDVMMMDIWLKLREYVYVSVIYQFARKQSY